MYKDAQTHVLLPADVSGGDGDKWRCAQWQCCGPWWDCDCVRLGLAVTVVLLCLSEGQRGQLDRPARQPAHQERLHAGDWPWLWGVG